MFRSFLHINLAVVLLLVSAVASADELSIDNIDGKAATQLEGSDARLQLIVTQTNDRGLQTDQSTAVTYDAAPEAIIAIDSDGLVTPLANGSVTVIATSPDGLSAQATLTVSGMDQSKPVSFHGQVTPIFTKLGCNGGGCHGKIAGQNGFRLSLLGFDPASDHRRLVSESRGRRVSIAAPQRSLLLQKTVGDLPHGGGARTDRDSYEYRVLRRWIAQGMPNDSGEIPQVTSIRVYPSVRRMLPSTQQQLAVIATYNDGTQEDVTRAAVYESNDSAMAEVTATGQVACADAVGDVAVMARYQGHVTVFRAEIPLAAETQMAATDFGKDWPVNAVDQQVHHKLASLGIPPSPLCDDATFLRRITLDLTGRMPTVEETQAFTADSAADKRERAIDQLLASDDYASFFARKWGVILRNRRTPGALQAQNMLFHHWLKESFRTNKPYDQLVSELLTARGTLYSNPAVAWFSQVKDQNERVEDISQLFLGQRIQCARCHHHPYEKWSQQDYAGLQAFFSTVATDNFDGQTTFINRIASPSARNPGNGQSVAPIGLDSEAKVIDQIDDPREELSRWMTATDNPFFAKSLANRYWKHFMGRGLVEPEDDMRVTNPPSNPELLDALAKHLIESGYDLQSLIRLICLSRTYNTSSQATDINVIDQRSYSRYYPKRMLAETLLDSIDTVTGSTTGFAGMPAGTKAVQLPDTGFNSYFLTVFGQPDSKTACECERSGEANLAQSLHLLNSEQIQQKLATANGRAVRLAKDTSRGADAKLNELYLTALSRKPTERELETALKYLGDQQASPEPWQDLIWALVNSKEFLFNH